MPVSVHDLPHLVALLDDPSEVVQAGLVRAFASFGLSLDTALAPLPELNRQSVHAFLSRHRNEWLTCVWPGCFTDAVAETQLELAMSVLSGYLSGIPQGARLAGQLDTLAQSFQKSGMPQDPLSLSDFLFVEEGIQGARFEYENPQHFDLPGVIDRRLGIPVSLGCLYVLVGRRLGYSVGGTRWPGHFFAYAQVNDVTYMVDPYHHGFCTPESSFLRMQGPSWEAARQILARPASTGYLVRRVIHNLIQAFHHFQRWDDGQRMICLLRETPKADN